jgi:hypothetical protein
MCRRHDAAQVASPTHCLPGISTDATISQLKSINHPVLGFVNGIRPRKPENGLSRNLVSKYTTAQQSIHQRTMNNHQTANRDGRIDKT